MGTRGSVPAPERKEVAEKKKVAKRKRSSAPSCSRARKKADRDAREAENAQRLDKLSTEVWEKVFNELESNDLFPLALSCKYFRQKQKELVEKTKQQGPESGTPLRRRRLTLTTNLRVLKVGWRLNQPPSADYLRFYSKEKRNLPPKLSQHKAGLIRRWAAHCGHLSLLQELLKPVKFLDPYITWDAGESFSQQSRLLLLLSASDFFLLFTARGGQLEIVQWLIVDFGLGLDSNTFAAACEGGNLAIPFFLRVACFCPWDASACEGAAKGGHLDILKWLRREGCPWDARACAGAASGGHLDVLKWLRSEGCPWGESACANAASGGHNEFSMWLSMGGSTPYKFGGCSNATGGGHLEILKWLRSEGCPWDEWTCAGAAVSGHLEALKWLRSEGCPWDMRTCTAAAMGGHLDVLQWAIGNDCSYEVNYLTEDALEYLGSLDSA